MTNETEKQPVACGMSTTTKTSMCLNVRGGIRMIQGDRSRHTWLNHDDGRPMTRDEGINALMDELAKGRETIPLNPKCGNPCQNSPLCVGFDFGVNGGCPGYVIETPEKVRATE